MSNQPFTILLSTLRLSFFYSLFAGIWIFCFDQILPLLFHNQKQISIIQSYQEWVLVILTAVLLYLIQKYQLRQEDKLEVNHHANILDIAADAIIGIDENQRIIIFNKGAEKIFGYQAQQVIGEQFNLLLPDYFQNKQLEEIHEIWNIGKYQEIIARCQDGTEFAAEVSVAKYNYNQQTNYALILRNISDRKPVEERLRLLELVVVNTNDAIVISKANPIQEPLDPTIVYVNKAFTEMTGYAPEDIIGKTPLILQGAKTDPSIVEKTYKAILKGEPSRVELINYTKDGCELWVEMSIVSIIDESSRNRYCVVVQREITHRKQVEATLHAINKELESRADQKATDLMSLNQQLLCEIVERKRAEDELKRQNLRSRLFSDIALKIRQSLELDEILQITVTEVRQMLNADRVVLFRILPDGAGTVVTESVETDLPILLGKTFSPEVFPPDYHHLYRNGRVQNIENVENANISPCHIEFLEQLGVKAKLVVPILQRENLWGLMIAHQCYLTRKWSDFEIELLQQLATQVGIALDQCSFLQAVQESEKQLRQLTENINEVFWLVSPYRNHFIYISPAYEKIWGRSCKSLYENPDSWLDSIHPEDRDQIICNLGNLVPTQEKIFNEEYRIIRPDGSFRWIWTREFPIKNESGEIYRIAGIAEDITDRKQGEDEIKKALEKEKELNELKSRFISMASHEFRTPLATILASSDLLKQFGEKLSLEKKQDRLNKIQIEVKNMTRLLDDVLVIGKAEAGKIRFEPTYLNLEKFCREITEELVITDKQNHQLDFKSDGNCQTAYMDEKLLRHILTNLLSNAIKYSPAGSIIDFELFCEEEQAVFKIKDQGIGIPEADQEHLFEPFHRATNVGNISGTGLGMSIIKSAVEVHGGSISVSSKVGLGTTFIISLPLSKITEQI